MKSGHARSAALHVSRHGSSSAHVPPGKAGRFALRGMVALVCVRRAARGTWLAESSRFLFLDEEEVEEESASPHRGKDTAQSQVLYAIWQLAQLCTGEYQSRPQANVNREVVKFAMYWMRGSVTDVEIRDAS